MNSTDFLFGALAGFSSLLFVGAIIVYRTMRPYVKAAAAVAKKAKAAQGGPRPHITWPPFGTSKTSNREEGNN